MSVAYFYFLKNFSFSELYKALKQSIKREQLDPISERTAKLLIEEFEQSGIQLSESDVFFKLLN